MDCEWNLFLCVWGGGGTCFRVASNSVCKYSVAICFADCGVSDMLS